MLATFFVFETELVGNVTRAQTAHELGIWCLLRDLKEKEPKGHLQRHDPLHMSTILVRYLLALQFPLCCRRWCSSLELASH